MWNIIFGLALLAAGLSGRFLLRGTDSSAALAAFGGVLIVLGIYQVNRDRRNSATSKKS